MVARMLKAAVTAVFLLVSLGTAVANDAVGPLDRAYAAMYNLDFAAAHATLRDYQATKPADPRGPISVAAAVLFEELDRQRLLDARYFAADDTFKSLRKRPDAAVRASFEDAVMRGERMAA